MPQEVTRIKKRIKSVSASYKITSAMKLVSTVKLKRWKAKMLANKDYASKIDEIAEIVFSSIEKSKNPFFQERKADKNLYIVLSSSLGLCGAYNNNIFRVADAKIKDNDDAIIEFITKEYIKGVYQEIHIIYTSYKNSLVFHPVDYTLLPLKVTEKEKNPYPPIMEPNQETLINALVPIYLKNSVYAKFLESEVCEQAARSNAMENATKNAEELLENLQIEFNKARQGAITQEITEIVGASQS